MKKETKALEAITYLEKHIKKNLAMKVCESELMWGCGSCKGHIILSFLRWYKELLK